MSITAGYCTVAQLKGNLPPGLDSSDDATFERVIEAASRQIDAKLGYRVWQDSSVATREYHADSPLCVEIPDGISTTTGLVVSLDSDGDGTFETTLTISTDFLLRPDNAGDDSPVEPYTEIVSTGNYYFPRHSNGRPGVRVVAKFGWPAVPKWAEQACILQAIHLFKAKDAPFGIATFGDMGALRVGRGLNPIADALVDPYAFPAVG